MEDSRRPTVLFIKWVAMLVVVALSYTGLLYYIVINGKDNYLAATFNKMKLLENTLSPKMVLVGGSNIAFGLDSTKTRQAFGLPVVNMGLHSGLGLKFMLDQVKPYINKNDIVVIVPEYSQYVGDSFYGDEALLEVVMITKDWSALGYIPALKIPNIALRLNRIIFSYYNEHVNSDSIYSRNSFNSDGDLTAHLALPNVKFSIDYKALPADINQKAIRYLYNFIATNADHGITTLILYPCLARSYYHRQAATIAKIAGAFSNNGIHVLSSAQDFVYDDDLFFNTHYHLNAQGRSLHTEKTIQALKVALMDRTLAPTSTSAQNLNK